MADHGPGEKPVLRVFTHPACSACSRVVHEAWAVGRALPGIEVRTVSLENKPGLAEARSEGITTIPSVILSSPDGELRRWIGSPEPGALAATLEELRISV